MRKRVLVVPDKFKGTLTAEQAARAMARGWLRARPEDRIETLPMSDGGDGFGSVLSLLLKAMPLKTNTVDAAHRFLAAPWWWEPNQRTAIIESARVVGLARMPKAKFHPFQLDTFGLGALLRGAAKKRAGRCIVGIGGSATNDGGFGLARALGWKFLNLRRKEIREWWQLRELIHLQNPKRSESFRGAVTIALDVMNPLLGLEGCSRIYGPQKGLEPEDIVHAEKCLERLAKVAAEKTGADFSKTPGAGAAGGLGFGLMTFAGGKTKSGFEIFAERANLAGRLREVNLVITGEGSIDEQTLMGKGVGQIAALCRRAGKPCIALAGCLQGIKRAQGNFTRIKALTDLTSKKKAMENPRRYLENLAFQTAQEISRAAK